MKKIAGVLAVLLGLSAQIALADIPGTINYQGRLTDTAGNPVANGTYGVTFALHYTAEGNSPTGWSEVQNVETKGGYFIIALGSQNSLSGLGFNYPYYLEIHVAGDAQSMSPRQLLSSVPYAMRAREATHATAADSATTANNASNLGGFAANTFIRNIANSVSNTNLQSGSVTQDKAQFAPAVSFNGALISYPKIAAGYIDTNESGEANVAFSGITFSQPPVISCVIYHTNPAYINPSVVTIESVYSTGFYARSWYQNGSGTHVQTGPLRFSYIAIGQ
ncbi:MAG: hypothetical protein AB1439_10845 [candidate division FCPU426 bacterium]